MFETYSKDNSLPRYCLNKLHIIVIVYKQLVGGTEYNDCFPQKGNKQPGYNYMY